MSPVSPPLNNRLSRRDIFTIAALVFVVIVTAGAFLWTRPVPSAQPMRFSHKAHFEDATCEACHLYVMEHTSAGTPTLEDCADCHDGIQSEDPDNIREEKKLEVFIEEEKEIPWVRLPPLTSDIFFSHRRHLSLPEEDKIECEVCHGKMAETETLPSKRPVAFTMDFCLDCHETHERGLDCIDCHR